jgi:hypothetical protein
MAFTGLRLEQHEIIAGEQVCVAYMSGKRIAVLYFHPQVRRLQLVHEAEVKVSVVKHKGSAHFERQ